MNAFPSKEQENSTPNSKRHKITIQKTQSAVPGEPIVVKGRSNISKEDMVSWNFLEGPTDFCIDCNDTVLLPALTKEQFPSRSAQEDEDTTCLSEPDFDSKPTHFVKQIGLQCASEMKQPVTVSVYKDLPSNYLSVRGNIANEKVDFIFDHEQFDRDWWTKTCKKNSNRYFLFMSLCRTIPEKFDKLKTVNGWREEYVSFLSYVKYLERLHSDFLEMDVLREPFMSTCDVLTSHGGDIGTDEICCNVSFDHLVKWLKQDEGLHGPKRQTQCLALRNTLM